MSSFKCFIHTSITPTKMRKKKVENIFCGMVLNRGVQSFLKIEIAKLN